MRCASTWSTPSRLTSPNQTVTNINLKPQTEFTSEEARSLLSAEASENPADGLSLPGKTFIRVLLT
jgi:hypothetical protein